jgi:hypothetical protein
MICFRTSSHQPYRTEAWLALPQNWGLAETYPTTTTLRRRFGCVLPIITILSVSIQRVIEGLWAVVTNGPSVIFYFPTRILT